MLSAQAPELHSGEDAVRLLLAQHRRIAHLFAQLAEDPERDYVEHFLALRCLLAVHETIEEQIVHPLVAPTLAAGPAWARARAEEESATTQTLSVLEGIPVETGEFISMVNDLHADVVGHFEIEEQQEYPAAAALFGPDDLRLLSGVVGLVGSLASPASAASTFQAMADYVRAQIA